MARPMRSWLIGVAIVLAATGPGQLAHHWTKTEVGAGYGSANAVTADADGNVYVCGAIAHPTQSANIGIVKYGREGATLWSDQYDGPDHDQDMGVKIARDASGNVYVYGISFSANQSYDLVLIKYNAAGSRQWVFRYDGNDTTSHEAVSLVVDASGNCYLGATLLGPNRIVVIKVGPSGVVDYTYTHPSVGSCWKVLTDSGGRCYAVGSQADPLATTSDLLVIRIGATGGLEKATRYHGPGVTGLSVGKSFDFTPDGGIVATGTLASDTGQLFAVVRFDANLDPVWTTLWPADGGGFGVVWTPLGDVIASGEASAALGVEARTLRLAPDGSLLGSDALAAGIARRVVSDAAGNPYVVGERDLGGDQALFLTQFGPSLTRYGHFEFAPASGGNRARDLTVDGRGDVVVVGTLVTAPGSSALSWAVLQFRQAYDLPIKVALGDWPVSPAGRVYGLDVFGAGTTVVSRLTGTLDGQGQALVRAPLRGHQRFRVKASHWLAKAIPDHEVLETGTPTLNVGPLTNGDVNDDNTIGIADFLALRRAFGSVPGNPTWNENADLNGSGGVSVSDFLILRRNFGQVGE